MTATTLDLDRPSRVLAVGAHPDDVEFGCGATLAKWAALGSEVFLVVCTDGSKGTWDPAADIARLVETREDEARAAALELGANGQVVFLGRVDGELHNDRPTRSELARVIRELRPDVLLGHDPWKRYRLHPDHRAAGFLTCDALVAARDPHFFAEHGMPHHRPDALLLFEADDPDHAESFTAEHLDLKIRALEAHRSQHESTMFMTGAEGDRQRFHARIRQEAQATGEWAGVSAAERFRLVPTDR